MPKCYKCGKILVTEQCLKYHLQKKNKCNNLFCKHCKTQFSNKTQFDNHECIHSKFKLYSLIESKTNNLIEIDSDFIINYVSNNLFFHSTSDVLIKRHLSYLLSDNFNTFMENILNSKKQFHITINKIDINIEIHYFNNYILIVFMR